MKNLSKYITIIYPNHHRKCFSLGVHFDFKNRYITLHFAWWVINFGVWKDGPDGAVIT